MSQEKFNPFYRSASDSRALRHDRTGILAIVAMVFLLAAVVILYGAYSYSEHQPAPTATEPLAHSRS